MHYFKRTLSFTTVALVTALTGCAGEETVDCTTVKPYSELTGFTNACVSCHSTTLAGPDRAGAPDDINYDTYAASILHVDETHEQIELNAMPPASSTPLSAAEKADIITWLHCETPE